MTKSNYLHIKPLKNSVISDKIIKKTAEITHFFAEIIKNFFIMSDNGLYGYAKTDVKQKFLASKRPLSEIFNSGITNNAKNAIVMNGA